MHTLPPIRPRRRQSSAEKSSAKSQSCDQLSSSSGTSKQTSPVKTLYSLPERLSDSSDNLDFKESQDSRRCKSCEGILAADEQMHTQLTPPLPAPLDATTQTKRKKNFMDRCVNKVRLC